MENFKIIENVPTVQPPVVERAVGHLANLGIQVAELGRKAGVLAVLAYSRPYDSMHDTDTHSELLAHL